MLSSCTRDFLSDSGLYPRCHTAFSDHYTGLLYSVRVPQPDFDLMHIDIFEKHRAVTLRRVPQFGSVYFYIMLIFIYLAAPGLSCGMQDLVP